MRVVVLGKRPPLQGGVSVRTFEFATSLVDAGHSVDFFSNAQSASPTYKCSMRPEDLAYLDRYGDRLTWHSLPPNSNSSHIPFSPSYETRLFGLAIDMAAQADLIIGWYFQPYGVVAADLAKATDKPCVVLHAGSDLGRLCNIEVFRQAYTSKFRHVKVLTTGEHTASLLKTQAGFKDEQIQTIERGFRLPRYFRTKKSPIDLLEVVKETADDLKQWPINSKLLSAAGVWNRKSFDPDVPTIGVYGKVGRSKGHFELVACLERLAANGVRFNFIMCTGGHVGPLEEILDAIFKSPALSAQSWIVPFIAPWRIPEFIRACDVVCFLERGFDVEFHGPSIPKEVLHCGRALLLSREIRRKQRFCDEMQDGLNFFDAGDPRDEHVLEAKLRQILESTRGALRRIGECGRLLVHDAGFNTPPGDPVVRTLEKIGVLKK